MPYYLHAILIHDGTAESGHYYSYVYDRKLEQWWRLSDVNVQPEVESVVMEEAFGGMKDSLKTGSCLIYINQFCLDQVMKEQTSAFLMGQTTQIPYALKEQVIKENNSFLQ